MRKRPLGCLTIPGIITGLLVILVVIGFGLLYGGKIFSPGILNAQAGALIGDVTSHAALTGRCSSCHAFFWQRATMTDRCLACHTDVAAQLNDPGTLHGDQLSKRPGQACRACHPDHRGADAALIDTSMIDTSHDNFGFVLTTHQKQADGSPFTCRTCHASGYTTFDQAVCVTCHQQLNASFMPTHAQDFGQDCLACHDGVDSYGHSFSHANVLFKLTGKHLQVDCSGCHAQSRNIADLKATPMQCGTCHAKDDAHLGELSQNCSNCHTTDSWVPANFDHSTSLFPLTGAHASLDCGRCHLNNLFISIDSACYSCHAKDDPHNGQFGTFCDACHDTSAWQPPTFNHAKSKFPLTGAHASLVCLKCHNNNYFTSLDPTCYSCHAKDDPHNGQFGTYCDACHDTSAWMPPTFDHAKSKFPLTGAHASLGCSKCHINNIFTALDTACYSCHAKDDAHNGQFGQDCGQCHTTNAWLPANFDHTKTGFTLTGAHVNLDCSQCHAGNIFTHLDTACYSCHAKDDAHNGQFGQDCGQCHSTSAWLPASFDHSKTGFNLTGAHTSLACSSCHSGGSFGGLSPACSSCHAKDDAHNGNFGTDCGSCHSTSAWQPASFDHSKSGFPLTGAHSSLACSQCHGSGSFSGLSPVCSSCHSDPAFHAGLFSGMSCDQCHNTSAWSPAQFNQAHPDACNGVTCVNHEGASCRDCHTVNLMTSSCLKCHDSNNPGGGGG